MFLHTDKLPPSAAPIPCGVTMIQPAIIARGPGSFVSVVFRCHRVNSSALIKDVDKHGNEASPMLKCWHICIQYTPHSFSHAASSWEDLDTFEALWMIIRVHICHMNVIYHMRLANV